MVSRRKKAKTFPTATVISIVSLVVSIGSLFSGLYQFRKQNVAEFEVSVAPYADSWTMLSLSGGLNQADEWIRKWGLTRSASGQNCEVQAPIRITVSNTSRSKTTIRGLRAHVGAVPDWKYGTPLGFVEFEDGLMDPLAITPVQVQLRTVPITIDPGGVINLLSKVPFRFPCEQAFVDGYINWHKQLTMADRFGPPLHMLQLGHVMWRQYGSNRLTPPLPVDLAPLSIYIEVQAGTGEDARAWSHIILKHPTTSLARYGGEIGVKGWDEANPKIKKWLESPAQAERFFFELLRLQENYAQIAWTGNAMFEMKKRYQRSPQAEILEMMRAYNRKVEPIDQALNKEVTDMGMAIDSSKGQSRTPSFCGVPSDGPLLACPMEMH